MTIPIAITITIMITKTITIKITYKGCINRPGGATQWTQPMGPNPLDPTHGATSMWLNPFDAIQWALYVGLSPLGSPPPGDQPSTLNLFGSAH